MKKALIIFSFFIYFFYFSLSSVFAQTNFKTDYNVAYNVLENALTHVTFDVTLTNQTSQYYASSYAIQVGFENIENVLASDSQGKIVPKVTKNNDGNNIELTFNDRVVGLDKKLTFKISFDTKDIAQKSGKIWDINIPGLAKQIEYNSFNVKVIVPKFLGNPSYIKPDIGKFDGANLNFTKEELGESGISISFGNEEIYEFDLLYHLKNPNLFPVKTEIALPPTTNYQEVQVQEIDPKPQNVIEDSDGNWLAQYVLAPSKKIDIRVKGQVSSALTVLTMKQFSNLTIPVIGLAKRKETIVTSDLNEISLPKASVALKLIMRIRDEAHRFAITYHRKLRSKRMIY